MAEKPYPTEEPGEDPAVPSGADASDDADVEGHSLSLVMGLDALGRTRDRERTGVATRADEELTPLTKTFPRLRDDRRR